MMVFYIKTVLYIYVNKCSEGNMELKFSTLLGSYERQADHIKLYCIVS